jgi:hypothetical protein
MARPIIWPSSGPKASNCQRHVREQLPADRAGVGDQAIQAAEPIERRPHGAGHGILVADVALHTERRGAQPFQLGDRLSVALLATRPDGDGRAGPGDAASDAEPDAAVAARDDDDTAGKINHRSNLRTGYPAGRRGWPPLAAYVRAWGPASGLHRAAACRDVVRAPLPSQARCGRGVSPARSARSAAAVMFRSMPPNTTP